MERYSHYTSPYIAISIYETLQRLLQKLAISQQYPKKHPKFILPPNLMLLGDVALFLVLCGLFVEEMEI